MLILAGESFSDLAVSPSRRVDRYCAAALLVALTWAMPVAAQTPPADVPTTQDSAKSATAIKSPKPAFLRVVGTGLTLNGAPFQNIGANMPDLFERFLHGDDATAEKSLADAAAAGIRLVRCFGSTWGPADFHVFLDDRSRWLAAYDRMLDSAAKSGVGLVPSLLFNSDMLPAYLRMNGQPNAGIVDLLTPGTRANGLAIEYVTAIVTHYRANTRVLIWEIGNEYNLEADLSTAWKQRPPNQIPTSDQIRAFLAQMATLIRSIDKRHPITSGNADMRPYAWHIRQAMLAHKSDPDPLAFPMDWTPDTFDEYRQMMAFFEPPPLSVISVHQYGDEPDAAAWITPIPNNALMLPWTRTASDLVGKPLFVGEFGMKRYVDGKEQPALWEKDEMSRLLSGQAPISAIWAWEYRSDDPNQALYSVDPKLTPTTVNAIANANQRLLSIAIQSKIPVQKPPPPLIP